ncbi:7-deoxyloganetic acid glucosyltransferase [Morus notabilis]|uniref:7-deoxyloganetic acid glucosyltransferase n=1 Tax=Morus notabilis TaxID=981085 RepID=UPI000CED2B2B|nr:7-deoxyloganetic acid glucosyltransferase [Morus notabilis]
MDQKQRPQVEVPTTPRVLIFPLPAQGHVTSMLTLAELLSLCGIDVTFLNTDHVHNRLFRHADIEARFADYPGLLFRTISDGLPDDHPRSNDRSITEVLHSMIATTKPVLNEMLVSGALGSVTCIIADGAFAGFVTNSACELHVPIIYYQPASACCLWTLLCFDDIIKAGELPIRGKEDMDRIITSVPGMKSFLRCRDLPSFCQVNDTSATKINPVARAIRQSCSAQGIILNTFEELEGPIISHIIRSFCPNTYTIGPLHAHLKHKLAKKNVSKSDQSSNSIFEVDRKCMDWLDSQPPKSVIYVSFGSITTLTRDALLEFWHGLVNSNVRFLWVVRPDMLTGECAGEVPSELLEATRERGYMVRWAPQEEVLSHRAVGGFLTHSGWNSTLESIVAGVPMICWPYFADQQINSRFVGEVWKLGIDMKDVCDRKIVEKMVIDLTVERREEFLKSTAKMARLAGESVCEGGLSDSNFDRLVEYIRLTAKEKSAR